MHKKTKILKKTQKTQQKQLGELLRRERGEERGDMGASLCVSKVAGDEEGGWEGITFPPSFSDYVHMP